MEKSPILPDLSWEVARNTKCQRDLAVAALTTAGYAGMLTGPAAIGFLSKAIGLHNAFWFLAAILACVPILGKHVAAETH